MLSSCVELYLFVEISSEQSHGNELYSDHVQRSVDENHNLLIVQNYFSKL